MPYHWLVRTSPSISTGEAGTTNSSASASCSGSARQRGCQPVRSERHMQKRNSGYSIRCCSRRASAGAKMCCTFIEVRLACMLLAYMTLESATYTQKAVSSHRNGRKVACAAALASCARSVPAAVSAGAMRSEGKAFMLRSCP